MVNPIFKKVINILIEKNEESLSIENLGGDNKFLLLTELKNRHTTKEKKTKREIFGESSSDEEILKELNTIGFSKQDIVSVIEEMGINYIDLQNIHISNEVAESMDIDILKAKLLLPYYLNNSTGEAFFASADITETSDKEIVREKLGQTGYGKVKFFFAFKHEIEQKFNYFKSGVEGEEINDVKEDEEKARRFLYSKINEAIELNASDIHFEPQKKQVKIRYRVDGVLLNEGRTRIINSNLSYDEYSKVVNASKIQGGMDISEKRKPQDGRIKDYMYRNNYYDIRVSIVTTIFGEKVVMRILSKDLNISNFKSLGFEEDEVLAIKKILSKKNGIVLLGGATGSGKTTTLYTMIDHISSDEINISTVEDPVERNIEGVNHIQVTEQVGFGDILRSLLRQDPDVIVVGEVRDSETAELSIKAALTGHLVIATIHANNSADIVSRLVNLDIEKYLIAGTAVGYVSQRLARKLCEHCKEEAILGVDEKKWLEKMKEKYQDISTDTIYMSKGCDKCNKTGYKGRTALVELIEITDDLREQIESGKNIKSANSLEKAGLKKIFRGITSVKEILRVV